MRGATGRGEQRKRGWRHGDIRGLASIDCNDVGRVSLRCTVPLFVDEYRRNRVTGSFILIDEATFETVGAGMVLGASAA